jgi:hypothetical protein
MMFLMSLSLKMCPPLILRVHAMFFRCIGKIAISTLLLCAVSAANAQRIVVTDVVRAAQIKINGTGWGPQYSDQEPVAVTVSVTFTPIEAGGPKPITISGKTYTNLPRCSSRNTCTGGGNFSLSLNKGTHEGKCSLAAVTAVAGRLVQRSQVRMDDCIN